MIYRWWVEQAAGVMRLLGVGEVLMCAQEQLLLVDCEEDAGRDLLITPLNLGETTLDARKTKAFGSKTAPFCLRRPALGPLPVSN